MLGSKQPQQTTNNLVELSHWVKYYETRDTLDIQHFTQV